MLFVGQVDKRAVLDVVVFEGEQTLGRHVYRVYFAPVRAVLVAEVVVGHSD